VRTRCGPMRTDMRGASEEGEVYALRDQRRMVIACRRRGAFSSVCRWRAFAAKTGRRLSCRAAGMLHLCNFLTGLNGCLPSARAAMVRADLGPRSAGPAARTQGPWPEDADNGAGGRRRATAKASRRGMSRKCPQRRRALSPPIPKKKRLEKTGDGKRRRVSPRSILAPTIAAY